MRVKLQFITSSHQVLSTVYEYNTHFTLVVGEH